MKQYLATTAASEIWDTEGQLLLLGPWCLSGENKKLLQGKDYLLLPSPWKPTVKLKEAADYCYDTYLNLLPQMAVQLNELHGVSYPLRYWQILIGPWILSFTKIFYERYRRIENSVHLFPDAYTHVIPVECCDLSTHDTQEFMTDKVNNDIYNLKIFSVVGYALKPRNLITTQCVSETRSPRKYYAPNLKTRIFNNITRSLFSGTDTILVDMYHLRNIERLTLNLSSKVGFIDFFGSQSFFYQDVPFDSQLRNKIKLTENRDAFHDLLCQYIPSAIPKCYIEDFRKYHEYVSVVRKGSRKVKAVGSAVGWFYNEVFKFFVAQLAISNTKLIEFQHGGGYGIFLSNLQERTAKEKDYFYIWGLSLKKDGKEKYLPSPHLSRLKDSHHLKDDNLLFISTGVPRYPYRFSTFLQPDDMPKYFEDERIFISRLKEDIHKQLLYRPYMIDYGWGEKESMRNTFSDMKFLHNGDLMGYLKRARLAVIDHPHTSFLEALVINVPCIFYWDHSIYLMKEEAEEYLEPLRITGILYKDPESAAEKANQIYYNSLDWWVNPQIQKARNYFCQRYARADKDWINMWADEFKILNKSNRDAP